MKAKQGHIYLWEGIKVMAMETDYFPEVRVMDHERPWPLTVVGRVDATSLTPLPMAYFLEKDNTEVVRRESSERTQS
jgi:hypothetical protein